MILISDHTYRANPHNGVDGKPKPGCAYLGTCGRPAAEHAAARGPRAAITEPPVSDAPAVDWNLWRLCRVCRAEIGQPCLSQSGRVVGGATDGVVTALERPHVARQRRQGEVVDRQARSV